MTEREKLLDLIDEVAELHHSEREAIADHLLANGVTVQKWIPVTDQGAKSTTNADGIRAMNDEQLSMFLWRFDREELARESDCMITRVQILKWLQQPVKEAP